MSKINWLAKKKFNLQNIDNYLVPSLDLNQFTNYGPGVKKLESWFAENLGLDSDRSVIVVSNGAAALHILAAALDISFGKKRQYVTGDYAFPCVAQGYLLDSFIVDTDRDGGLNLEQIEKGEGLIVTNLFGHCVDIDKYLKFCEKRAWPCIFDNACASYTFYQGKNVVNYGDGCIISLHHTKPIGFGEGGLIVLKKEYEDYARRLINFGFSISNNQVSWHPWGNNAKMSDISAVFIYDYLTTNFKKIVETNTRLYQEFTKRLQDVKNFQLLRNYSDPLPLVNCLPLCCNHEITGDHLYTLELNGITARKYYTPLVGHENASKLFKHIICLPIHVDLTVDDIDRYVKALNML